MPRKPLRRHWIWIFRLESGLAAFLLHAGLITAEQRHAVLQRQLGELLAHFGLTWADAERVRRRVNERREQRIDN